MILLQQAQQTKPSLTAVLWLLAALAINLGMLSYRRPDAIKNAQFWAEDGAVFCAQMYDLGPRSIFKQYAGYYHLFPRLVAVVGELSVSKANLPLFYNVCAIASFLATNCYIWYKVPAAQYSKCCMIVALTLIPVGNEVFVNITNSQWVLALILILPFVFPAHSKIESSLDCLVVAICGFTGPFCIIFCPLVIMLLFQRKHLPIYRPSLSSLIYALAFCVQFHSILLHPRATGQFELAPFAKGLNRVIYMQVVHWSHLPALMTMSHIRLTLMVTLAILLSAALFGYKAFKAALKNNNPAPFAFLSIAFLVLASTIYTCRSNLLHLHPYYAGCRYFYIPSVMIFWALILYFKLNVRRFVCVASAALLIMAPFCSRLYSAWCYEDFEWQKHCVAFEKPARPLSIPINPKGWKLRVTQKREPLYY